jgi:hypothetical protein
MSSSSWLRIAKTELPPLNEFLSFNDIIWPTIRLSAKLSPRVKLEANKLVKARESAH